MINSYNLATALIQIDIISFYYPIFLKTHIHSRKVKPYILRHSFAIHLLESGIDLSYIQTLEGHNSSRITKIYTHIATTIFKSIQNPLDC